MNEKELINKIQQSIREEKPYILVIENLIKEIRNGVIELTLRVYNGKVTDILDGKYVRRTTFKVK